jgi:hypothetical protein
MNQDELDHIRGVKRFVHYPIWKSGFLAAFYMWIVLMIGYHAYLNRNVRQRFFSLEIKAATKKGSFVFQILIYRMGRLVHGKTAIANFTKAFLLTILALLHINARFVTVPYLGAKCAEIPRSSNSQVRNRYR